MNPSGKGSFSTGRENAVSGIKSIFVKPAFFSKLYVKDSLAEIKSYACISSTKEESSNNSSFNEHPSKTDLHPLFTSN